MNLQTKIIAATSAIVVTLGLLTVIAINTVVANTLTRELAASGLSLVQVLGEAVANPLLDGDLLAVQETLNNMKATRPDIVYAYAFGPVDRAVVHTFPNGFPADLLIANFIPTGQLSQSQLLMTEVGPVLDIGWRPLDGLSAEVHIGFSESELQRTLGQVTWVVAGLTLAGILTGVIASYTFGRFVTQPLTRLIDGVRRLGTGHLDEAIPVGGSDEIGDLSRAFNRMAADLSASIGRLLTSEAGYRALIEAASQVGEGIALIRDEGPGEGTFLFVNDEFSRLTGYPREKLLNLNAAEVIHPQSVDEVYAAWQAFRARRDTTLRHEMTLVTRDGHKLMVETGGTLIDYEGQRALAWFTRDVTERKAREDEIQRRNRELAALNAVSAVMSGPGDVDAMLQRALEQALVALELPAGWVFIANGAGTPPQLAAMTGLPDLKDGLHAGFPGCDCGSVLRAGQPVVVNLHEGCTAWEFHTSEGHKIGCHGTVPLIAGGRVMGVLSAAGTSSASFDADNFRLLIMVGRQMGVALENARLWKELQEKERLRADLLAKAIQAQEDERRRVARELHDETGQSLNAMVFGLKAAEAALTANPSQAGEILVRLKAAAGDTVRELQTIIYDLRPSLLDDLGLAPALRWYAETRLEVEGVRILWDITGIERRLPPEAETALFRIGQEAITNTAKYANAKEVHIKLAFEGTQAVLEIIDDGQGFDIGDLLKHPPEDGRGLGLLGMRERAELLRGKLEVESAPGRGTRVRADLPTIDPIGDDKRVKDSHFVGG